MQDVWNDPALTVVVVGAISAAAAFVGWFFRWLPDYISQRVETSEVVREEDRKRQAEVVEMRYRIELERTTARALSERVQADAMTMASSTISAQMAVIRELAGKVSMSQEAYGDLQSIIEQLQTIAASLDRLIYLYDPDKTPIPREDKEAV